MQPPATTAEVDPDPPADPEGRLSVALVSPGWPASAFANGVVTCVGAIAGGLRRRGHRVHILAQKMAGPGGDDVHDLYPSRPRSPLARLLDRGWFWWSPELSLTRAVGLAISGVARELADGAGLDLVEMEESFGWSREVARRCPLPVVVRLHGPWFLNGPAAGATEDDDYRRRLRAEGLAIAEAEALTAPSAYVLDQARAFYGLPLPEARVIPNAISIPPADRRWRPEDSDLGLILFVGRFDRHKGGDVVIDAFRRVAEQRPEARLCFVGPDKGFVDDDGRTWSIDDYLRARAPGLVESGRFEWRGQLPPDEVGRLRRGAAVTVVASRYENLPMAVLEALAQGCPLVATRAGGIPEIVRDGVDGLLCRPGDADDMARALVRLLVDRDLAAGLGRRAAEDCESRFSPDVVADRTIEYYRQVLRREGRPSAKRRGEGSSPSA